MNLNVEPSNHSIFSAGLRPLVTYSIEHTFSSEIERLRSSHRRSFTGTSQDEFDHRSSFAVARKDGQLVGVVRITRGPVLAHMEWTENQFPYLPRINTFELTRGVVAQHMRGQGIYRELMKLAVKYSFNSGAGAIIAATELTMPTHRVLVEHGFERIGFPIPSYRDTDGTTIIQPYALERINSHLETSAGYDPARVDRAPATLTI